MKDFIHYMQTKGTAIEKDVYRDIHTPEQLVCPLHTQSGTIQSPQHTHIPNKHSPHTHLPSFFTIISFSSSLSPPRRRFVSFKNAHCASSEVMTATYSACPFSPSVSIKSTRKSSSTSERIGPSFQCRITSATVKCSCPRCWECQTQTIGSTPGGDITRVSLSLSLSLSPSPSFIPIYKIPISFIHLLSFSFSFFFHFTHTHPLHLKVWRRTRPHTRRQGTIMGWLAPALKSLVCVCVCRVCVCEFKAEIEGVGG